MNFRAIAIDPGYAKHGDGCAVALFSARKRLAAWWFVRSRDWDNDDPEIPQGSTIQEVVWEEPQFDGRATPATMIASIHLAAEGGTLAGLYAGAYGAHVIPRTPQEWKGSEHKPPMHARLWDKMLPSERALFPSTTGSIITATCRAGGLDRWRKSSAEYYPRNFELHNILDAVALGRRTIGEP